MPIYLQYGGYAHDPSDAEVMISREGVTSELGIVYAVRERWNINGRLHANDLPGINAAVESLYEAYSHDRQDIELVGSSHVMRSHDTINGTRVAMPPSFPKGNGAENSTFRSYTLAVEGEFAFSGDGILLSWAETLSFRGVGGPKWGLLETLNGQWPLQQFTDMSAMFCTQRGSAIIAPASAQRNVTANTGCLRTRFFRSGNTATNGTSVLSSRRTCTESGLRTGRMISSSTFRCLAAAFPTATVWSVT